MKVLEFTLPKVNTSEVLRYMGVKNPTAIDLEEIEKKLNNITLNLTPKVVYEIFTIKKVDNEIDLGFTKTSSKLIRNNLKNANEVVLFTASIGLEIDRLINKYSLLSPSTALFYQALGTERVESLCDEFCSYISSQYKTATLTKRFSPGYGDIELSMQKAVFNALNPTKNIGVTLLDSMLMSPTKSVTALIGLSSAVNEKNFKKCNNCNNLNCDFRK